MLASIFLLPTSVPGQIQGNKRFPLIMRVLGWFPCGFVSMLRGNVGDVG